VLTAARAELDKAENKSVFTAAKYVSPGQGLVADHAVLHTTPDGTPQTLEADGHVVLTGNGDGSVRAPRMDAVMNEKGKLKSSHLSGGVRYADEANGRGSHGGSDEAWVNFDREGRAQHVLLTGAVSGEQRGLAATRSLSAARLELELTPDGNRTILQDAQATGSAKVREIALAKAEGKHSSTTTDMAGDTLLAHFEAVNGQAQIKSVHGMGHTLLHQLAEDGTDQTSTGNTLDMAFRPAEAAAAKTAVSGGGKPVKRPTQPIEIASAVQRGGIHVLRTLPPKPGASAEVQRASGDVETYDGDTDRVTLRGQAQVEDSTGSVYAEQVTLERASGDATASGGVRTTYLQARAEASGKSDSGNDDPTHVLADHASFQHDLGTAFFYGTPAKPARMWQATSQVQAPLLKVHQTEKKLIARGENTGDAVVVHAVMLTSSAKPEDNAAKPGAAPKSSKAPSLVHIASRVMVYSDLTRQVELTGKVRVEDSDGVMTADQALVYLTPAADGARQPKPVSAPQNGFLGGQVERIVATGNVQVDQPGRRAEGQQLVYTADDKTFVMTGTKSAPPKMISEGRGTDTPGTVAGTSLRFRSGDDSVLVTGGDGQTGPQRVKTETRVKADNKR
jgi:lipopolysaccharide export system protein LptA